MPKFQKAIDAHWAEEAERRDKEIEDGIVAAIPGEDVMKKLRCGRKRLSTHQTIGHTALD